MHAVVPDIESPAGLTPNATQPWGSGKSTVTSTASPSGTTAKSTTTLPAGVSTVRDVETKETSGVGTGERVGKRVVVGAFVSVVGNSVVVGAFVEEVGNSVAVGAKVEVGQVVRVGQGVVVGRAVDELGSKVVCAKVPPAVGWAVMVVGVAVSPPSEGGAPVGTAVGALVSDVGWAVAVAGVAVSSFGGTVGILETVGPSVPATDVGWELTVGV